MRSSHQNLCCSSILAPGASAFSNRCGVSRSTRADEDFAGASRGMAGRGMGAGGAGARAAGPGRRNVPRMACRACNAGGASGVSGMMGASGPPKAGGWYGTGSTPKPPARGSWHWKLFSWIDEANPTPLSKGSIFGKESRRTQFKGFQNNMSDVQKILRNKLETGFTEKHGQPQFWL